MQVDALLGRLLDPSPMKALGLDIDGTITAAPVYFSRLSRSWKEAGAKVYVISTRSDLPEVRRNSQTELAELGIVFDALHLLPGPTHAQTVCPHDDLDWFEKYLWQKVALAQQLGISVVFDDDEKVIALFQRFAPEVAAFGLADIQGINTIGTVETKSR